MTRDYRLFIVDDTRAARFMLEGAFGKKYPVESFASAEECLARLVQGGASPDIFLLDVTLPGMSGYELCRQIKALPGMTHIPVIFISSHDDLESRLEGYDAGGVDYVVKPFNLPELKQKVLTACRQSAERVSLHNQVLEAETLTSLILSNLDEYAVLIKFLRSLSQSDSPRAIVNSLFELLRGYRLECAVQLRLPGLEWTVSADGDNRPLEVAVIEHVRKMGRIFEFKRRAAYNFERLSILVNNVPCEDAELCGRLRDHLAIAAESADGKLESMQTKAEFTQAKGTAADLLGTLQNVLRDFEQKHTQARYFGSSLTQDMLDELARTFASLGLSGEQEARIDELVRSKTSDLADIYDFSGATQEALDGMARQLGEILSPTVATVADHGIALDTDPLPDFEPVVHAPKCAAVELF